MVLKRLKSFGSFLAILCFVAQASAYFELTMERFEQLSDTTLVDVTGMKAKKVGKDRKLFGNFTYNTDIDNSYKVRAEMFVKQGNEYRKTPYRVMDKNYCDFIAEDKYYFEEVCAVSDFKCPPECPHKKGAHKIRGFSPSFKNIPKVLLPSGSFAFEITYLKDEIIVGRFRFYFSVINF